MLKGGRPYAEIGEHYYEQKYRQRLLARLHQQAAHFGFQLISQTDSVTSVLRRCISAA